MKLEAVSIPSGSDTLAGLRYLPDRVSRDVVLLFAHGFTSGKYSMDSLAGYLAGRGWEGLTFDLVGHKLGASGGAMTHTEQAGENMRDALNWFRQNTSAKQVVLVGHSMGAAASLWTAAHEAGSVAGIVCLCMGTDPARGFESTIGRAMLAQRQDYVAGAPTLELLHGLHRLLAHAERINDLPALFIAARQDVLVPISRVEELAAQIGSSATVTVVESSHLEAPDRSRAAIAQWLEQSF